MAIIMSPREKNILLRDFPCAIVYSVCNELKTEYTVAIHVCYTAVAVQITPARPAESVILSLFALPLKNKTTEELGSCH